MRQGPLTSMSRRYTNALTLITLIALLAFLGVLALAIAWRIVPAAPDGRPPGRDLALAASRAPETSRRRPELAKCTAAV